MFHDLALGAIVVGLVAFVQFVLYRAVSDWTLTGLAGAMAYGYF